MKKCSRCERELPLDSFHKRSIAKTGAASRCKECVKELTHGTYAQYKVGGKKFPSKKNSWLRLKYGIGIDDFNALTEAQCELCAICGCKPEVFHVDHDHVTGKVRGLLCFNCNGGLGNFKDDVGRLTAAITYLEKPRLDG